jgi:hypothetical protein
MTAATDPKAIVIASAARTAVGSFNGAFATVPAHELGSRRRWNGQALRLTTWMRLFLGRC